MKTILKGAVACAALLASSPLLAQAGLVTVDLNRIFAESAAAKSGATQIQTKYQGQAQTQQNTFNSAATAYNTQVEAARKVVKPDGSLPDAQRNTLQTAETSLRNADEALNRTQQEANATGQFVRDQILRAVVPIAEQVRVERRASAVVPRNTVLAADPATDVTPLVIQRLDASLKTVSIQLPAAPAGQAAAPAAVPAAAAARPTTPAQGR